MAITVSPDLLPTDILKLIPQANANLENYRSSVASGVTADQWTRDFFARPAIVYLIFPDDHAEGGLDMIIAKGQPAMQRSFHADALIASTAALNVGCRAEALAMAMFFGDAPKPKWLVKAEEKRARKAARRAGRVN
jgi:hypothetical protein